MMKLFKNGELALLWPFYLESLIFPIMYFVPAFIIIYFLNLNFNMFQISIFFATMMLSQLIFELPTGVVADLYGRKISVLIGFFIEGMCALGFFLFKDYKMILLICAIMGIGSAFSSGAKEAWVTDLVKNNKKNVLHDYFVKVNSISNFGLIFSGIIGAFAVKLFGLSSFWIFSSISFLFSIIILLFAKEHFVKKKIKVIDSFKEIKKHSNITLKYSYNHKILFYIMLASAASFITFEFNGMTTWIPFIQSFDFPDYAFGFLWSGLGVTGVIAPIIGKKFYIKGKERMFLINIFIILMILTLLVVFANYLLVALFLMLAVRFSWEYHSPVERVYFHKFIPNKIRASVGSLQSMMYALIGIGSTPLVGYLVDKIGPQYTIFLGGILVIPVIIIYFSIKEKQ